MMTSVEVVSPSPYVSEHPSMNRRITAGSVMQVHNEVTKFYYTYVLVCMYMYINYIHMVYIFAYPFPFEYREFIMQLCVVYIYVLLTHVTV